MLLTITELQIKFNVSYSKLTKLISTNNISGFWFGRCKKYDENEIELNLKDYNEGRTTSNLMYDSKKITIIEFYKKYGSIRKVASMLSLGRATVTRTIDEYNDTGCVEVDSKLKKLKNI